VGLVAAALVSLPAIASFPPSFPDVPPPQHTGGFGEPTCHACHFDYEPDPAEGSVVLAGLPAAFEHDRTYRLTVRVTRPGLARAGYQLAVRFADGPDAGTQAGTLTVSDARSVLTMAASPEVAYAHHTREGTEPVGADTAAWALEWHAPDRATKVVIHLAVNAANGDASQFGDHVYTRAYEVPPIVKAEDAVARSAAAAAGRR
jgi:hypothetical protein